MLKHPGPEAEVAFIYRFMQEQNCSVTPAAVTWYCQEYSVFLDSHPGQMIGVNFISLIHSKPQGKTIGLATLCQMYAAQHEFLKSFGAII